MGSRFWRASRKVTCSTIVWRLPSIPGWNHEAEERRRFPDDLPDETEEVRVTYAGWKLQ